MPEQWEREIDELLRRRESKLPSEPVSDRLARKSAPLAAGTSGVLRAFLRRPPVEQFMISSIVLVALSYLLQILRIAPLLAYWAGILSLLLFVLALALSVAAHRGFTPRSSQRRWRERDVSYGPTYPTMWSSLRQWWRSRRYR